MKIFRTVRSSTCGVAIVATLALQPVHAEEFYIYDKDPATVTIFHMYPCKLNILNTGKEPAQHASVFSRSTNARIAQGCWRFADGSLNMLLKLESGKQKLITAFEVEKRERF